ncbi:hypothetical protein BSU04_46295 [Caballeronia sordidicola]|uniref:Uncharacterized protein n=1 Tax=Caballeronia sordidicola TaxID=196367 RepID=A0A226WKA0_CABSO|nr:hypothetical protein BSU04_46295 [Caballeronia sordidicola]
MIVIARLIQALAPMTFSIQPGLLRSTLRRHVPPRTGTLAMS